MNSQYLAEERRLEHYRLGVVSADQGGQVAAYQFVDVPFLHFGVVVEAGRLLGVCHPVARQQRHGVVFEKLSNAFVERRPSAVHGVVEIAAGQVAQVYGRSVGQGLYLVDEADERRLGVGFKTRGYGGDVNEIVGLVDYQLGHAYVAVEAHANEVELRALGQQALKVAPVSLAAARKVCVLVAVTHFQPCAVMLVGHVYVFVVPLAYHAPYAGVPERSPRLRPVALGQKLGERRRHGLPAAGVMHEQRHGLYVVHELFFLSAAACRGGRVQRHSCGVHHGCRAVGYAVLLYEEVELGERSHEVDAPVGNAVVSDAP